MLSPLVVLSGYALFFSLLLAVPSCCPFSMSRLCCFFSGSATSRNLSRITRAIEQFGPIHHSYHVAKRTRGGSHVAGGGTSNVATGGAPSVAGWSCSYWGYIQCSYWGYIQCSWGYTGSITEDTAGCNWGQLQEESRRSPAQLSFYLTIKSCELIHVCITMAN